MMKEVYLLGIFACNILSITLSKVFVESTEGYVFIFDPKWTGLVFFSAISLMLITKDIKPTTD